MLYVVIDTKIGFITILNSCQNVHSQIISNKFITAACCFDRVRLTNETGIYRPSTNLKAVFAVSVYLQFESLDEWGLTKLTENDLKQNRTHTNGISFCCNTRF